LTATAAQCSAHCSSTQFINVNYTPAENQLAETHNVHLGNIDEFMDKYTPVSN